MTEVEAHFEAAREAMAASRALSSNGQPVPAAFFACHAFEMAGAAYIIHTGGTPSRYHKPRVREFAAVAGRRGFGHGIGAVAVRVNALRNDSLYAKEDPQRGWRPPSQRVSHKQAGRLVSRVGGVLRVVDQQLP